MTISVLAVPTPFAIGPVNCLLVEDDPLTLVDTGPNSATSLMRLEGMLGDAGRRVEDLERIVITHQHLDHTGLTDILATRSGAEVVALEGLDRWLGAFRGRMEAEDDFAVGLMRRHGVPHEVCMALRSVSALARGWGARATVTRTIADGDLLDFAGRSWRVLHRPGHSPSDTVFHDAASGELIAGDHLLKHVSSNPLITRPLDADDDFPVSRRPQALVGYLASLAQTREMEVSTVYPGHGETFTGHAELIDERMRMHERRMDKLFGLIVEQPRSAHELAQALWGGVAITQAYLTLSEVLGHTDLLVNAGRVLEEDVDGVIRFTAAS